MAAETADATLAAATGAANNAVEAEVEGRLNAENATLAAADGPAPTRADFLTATCATCAATCVALKLERSTAGAAEEVKEEAAADEAAAVQPALHVCWDAPGTYAGKPVPDCCGGCAAPGSAAAEAPVPANPNPKFRGATPAERQKGTHEATATTHNRTFRTRNTSKHWRRAGHRGSAQCTERRSEGKASCS